MEIQDREKRRARNLIWNAAGDYSFEPDFKAYDQEGRADLYWNSIIGAVRKNYGEGTIHGLLESFHGNAQEQLFEQLVWLGLENAVYQRESLRRPALPALRRSYARQVLSISRSGPAGDLLSILEEAHFRRALGESPRLLPREREMLDALEFSGDLDGPALAQAALAFLRSYFHFTPGEAQEAQKPRKKHRFFFGFRTKADGGLPAVRTFGHGYGEHVRSDGGGAEVPLPERRLTDLNAAQTEAALRKYIAGYFGPPLYEPRQVAELERSLCEGDHKGCHLYYAKGSSAYDPSLKGYVATQRKAALKQMELNRAAYEADSVRNRNSVIRLTARIRNALMAYLQPTVVRSASGSLDAGRVWRGVYLDDDKVFSRVLQTDPGELCVDLLLDASTSQVHRQEIVSAQGYMIAESLTRCHIPVRVSSFCSISGYTILSRFRDYYEPEKNEEIFHYFTTGCNRDGLAVRALCREMEDAPCEHKLVILLSDAKPHDVQAMIHSGIAVDYSDQAGVDNTAAEVRSLLHRDIAVMCVFTGEDEDIPAAHTIYGRNFARIRSLDQFADTVGTLIQNQIRSL